MRPLLALASLLFLTACAASLFSPSDPESPFFVLPEGTVVTLHQPVEIPAGRARAWLQAGRATVGNDWYEPSCSLEVRRLDPGAPQVIAPDRFVITHVQRMEEWVQGRPGTLQAGGGLMRVAEGDPGGGDPWLWLGYHYRLTSERQPEVLRMTCVGAYARPSEALPPGLADIRRALGTFATVTLP
jgi:hypothetical protein